MNHPAIQFNQEDRFFDDDDFYANIDPDYDAHALEMDFDDELSSLLEGLEDDFDDIFRNGVIIP